ncbi:hypothetical protein BBBOND_0304470 [Babesia bigemina]|uniref:Uncharacterized protein n=1 Tax=Babesia bigemina TaxID=5866 RepID=A0A061DC69_BABBI|nr:hypothetical protein BBBOND_0304470 [Babesia bigemina]CDR96544.1 hypothetical protein BBBOND_0304470 [Babesia bigemina]|eukprot:XP_012768730.1 hypothetical protein BBBOND_0304470 [Babesia bigemina]
MAPKKLTDCPENLRESIDWLIQVRHGGDGNGLEHLGKALKKLIDEAIENAYTTNVDALLKLLKSAKSYTCCEDKVTKIETLKKSEKAAENRFDEIKNNCESIRGCSKKHLDSSQQKSFGEIESKLDQLKNLKESLKGITDETNCKELLTNLCDGLETFLGFNPSSKGYTGQGIVYGDLDRLCDGVMAFFLGVLESVKDDDDVMTYDSNNSMTKLIDTLKGNIRKGNVCFNDSMIKVSTWLSSHGEELGLRTGNVVTALRSLSGDIDTNIKSVKNVNTSPVKFDQTVSDWIRTVLGELKKHLALTNKYICGLDESLKIKLKTDFDQISTEVHRLRTSADRDVDQLRKLGKILDSRLESLRINIDKAVAKQVKKFHHLMTEHIDIIHGQIHKIDKILKEYVSGLEVWIRESERILTNTLDKIETILDCVKDGRNGNKGAGKTTLITDKSTEMKKNADALCGAYQKVKEDVQAQALKAVAEIGGLENVYKNKLNEMKSKIDSAVTDAAAGVKGLHKEVEKGLEVLRSTTIDRPIQAVIRKLKEGIGGASRADMAISIVQDFYLGLGGSDDAPKLYEWSNNVMAGGDLNNAIKELQQNDIAFKSFKAVLTQLGTFRAGVGGAYGKTFFDVLESDLKAQVKAAIGQIKHATGQLNLFFSAFHTQITGNSDDTVHGKIQKIKKQFDNDFDTNIPGEPKIKTEGSILQDYEDKKGALQTAINKTYNEAFEAANTMVTNITKNTFLGLHREITAELQKIANIVSNVSVGNDKGLKEILTELKNTKIIADLTGIKKNFDTLRTKFLKDLDTAVDTLVVDTLSKLSESTIESINQYLKDQVKHTIDDIKTDALKRYVISKTNELNELKDFVEKRRIATQKTIDDDLASGIKGLLDNISTWFYRNDDMKNVTVLVSIAEKFKDLNNLLHKYVKFQYDGLEVEDAREDDVDDVDSDSASSSIVAPPAISGGYKPRPIVPTLPPNDTRAPQPAGRAGYSGPVHSSATPTSQVSTSLHAHKDPIAEYFVALHYYCDGLLSKISANRFTTYFVSQRNEFEKFLSAMRPLNFSGLGSPLLDALKSGLQSLLMELGMVYISSYDGAAYDFNWAIDGNSEKCARVLLTILEILYNDLHKLWRDCKPDGEWNYNKINLKTDLGKCFKQCGYDVSEEDDSHEGQLRNKEEFKGKHIYDHLNNYISGAFRNEHFKSCKSVKQNNLNVVNSISCLFSHLKEYYKASHVKHIYSPRSPCSIFDMMCWLTGLRFNPMKNKLTEYIAKSYENETDSETKKMWSDLFAVRLPGIYRPTYNVLTTILGHGHADGIYACDFVNNIFNLSYPSDPSKCFDLLVSILYRVYEQLYFLHQQCRYGRTLSGWRDCWYGKGVAGSSWQCNNKQSLNQECDQTCKEDYNCGIKSPLQSFLEDGLPGFLPHSITKVGCGITCSMPKHSGIPCRTPMGFTNIALKASHTQKGQSIYSVLDDICGYSDKPLSKICSYMLCIFRTPPKTLGDMFAFYCNFLNGWAQNGKNHRSFAFQSAVNGAYFGEIYSDLDVNSIFTNDKSNNHINGNLACLISCDLSYTPGQQCGSYLRPFYRDIRVTFPTEHNRQYLSWVVYLTETFYKLLKELYEECCGNCKAKGTICHEKSCYQNCPIKKSPNPSSTSEHDASCKSIVHCTSTLPTLCKYGLYFGSAKWIAGKESHRVKRTCNDFCSALANVISEQSVLARLVHNTIPNFLWAIRVPFFHTTVALWLLSLLYLIYVCVGRLDLLHIKSHLHSPSSHRIAAQSLLAAARINKLNKVLYLQP